MPTSDFDVQRTAFVFIQLHGDEATAKAREMVEQMRRKGDHDGAAAHHRGDRRARGTADRCAALIDGDRRARKPSITRCMIYAVHRGGPPC